MLERWIVKHWIALSAGCLLMAAAVRMTYAQRGYAAIGGEYGITTGGGKHRKICRYQSWFAGTCSLRKV